MKKILIISLFAGFLASSAGADDTAKVRKLIEEAYGKATAAYAQRDARGACSFYADNAEITADDNKLTPSDNIANMKKVLGGSKSAVATYQITAFALSGNTAQATVKTHTELKLKGPDSKYHVLVVDYTADDSWINDGQKWAVKTSKIVTTGSSLDGKKGRP